MSLRKGRLPREVRPLAVLSVDLAVVGAGPAGLTAATGAARRGLRTAVLDEHPEVGGRLMGQLHEERLPDGSTAWWQGRETATHLRREAVAAGVAMLTGVQVWGLRPGWRLDVEGGGLAGVSARAVLLATGACEKPLPVPGWTLPGVMTAGAAQVFTNRHRVRPGNRVLICGVDPLSLTVSRELTLGGAVVVGMVLPPPGPLAGERAVPEKLIAGLSRMAHLAPSTLLRLAGQLFSGETGARLGARLYPRRGVKVWGVPLGLRQSLVRIVGTAAVTGAVVTDVDAAGRPLPGTERELAVDCVVISGGLSPVVELAAAAGCSLIPSGLGGMVPLHGETLETELAGLFLAGNITGVEGARVAMAQGTVAGVSASHYLGALADSPYRIELAAAQKDLTAVRAKAAIQFYPHSAQARAQLATAWAGRSPT